MEASRSSSKKSPAAVGSPPPKVTPPSELLPKSLAYFAGHFARLGRTHLGTFATVGTLCKIPVVLAVFILLDSAVGTDRGTGATRDTQIGEHHELGLETLGFGIAAPGAVQGTALEKNSGAQTRAVLGGHALNIVDDSFHGCSFSIFVCRLQVLTGLFRISCNLRTCFESAFCNRRWEA